MLYSAARSLWLRFAPVGPWKKGRSKKIKGGKKKSDAGAARMEMRAAPMESLELRRLLSVSMSSDGWTTVAPAADTRVIYVSSSTGNDQSNGLSPATAVRSIGR